ncbi:hypothetical protein [Mycobacterium sp. URHB0021]
MTTTAPPRRARYGGSGQDGRHDYRDGQERELAKWARHRLGAAP